MSIKKIFSLLILFSGVLACECFNAGSEWNIDSFDILTLDKQDNFPSNGIIEGDSVKLLLTFEAEFVEFISNPLSGLMNSAHATSCEQAGDEGLNDKVADFIITSNSDFNEIQSGTPLNDVLIVNGKKSITEWILNSDFWQFRYDSSVELLFKERPEISSVHVFNLKFIMESGKTVEQNTGELQWD